MARSMFSDKKIFAILSLVYVASSDIISAEDSCRGLGEVVFNATGSVKRDAFFPSSNTSTESAQWTWHTGLTQDPSDNGAAQQVLWVDTTGSVNLNDVNLDYDVCLQVFHDLPEEALANATADDGSCSSVVGDECLNALFRDAGSEGTTEGACTVISSTPMECMNKLSGSSSRLITRDEESQTNQTCGSTTNNPTGENSIYQTWALQEKDKEMHDGKSPYDVLAKSVYLVAAMGTRAENDSTRREYQFMCLRNTDFAEGSKNPTATETPKPSTTSTNTGTPSASPTGASVILQTSGWGWALVMGAFLYLG